MMEDEEGRERKTKDVVLSLFGRAAGGGLLAS